jgi:murein DD-endopeptidase MepM/ murein hydrolase activator NlpD
MKLNQAGCLISILVALLLVSGCASVRTTDTGNRGLFQNDSSIARGPVNVSIPPSVIDKSEFGFIWPVREGSVSSFFGKRRRDYHEGIDIRANRGNPVFAAKEGTVIYASRKIHGYGNMIVVKHADGLATVYAHNKKNLVKRGEHVTQGQLLAYVGATGKATGPHLHFEIRKGELPQDPLLYLPQVRAPAMAHK